MSDRCAVFFKKKKPSKFSTKIGRHKFNEKTPLNNPSVFCC